MNEAGALGVHGEAAGTVRVFENRHAHVDREEDGTLVVVHDTRSVVVGTFPEGRLIRAVALANRIAGPPRKPKP